MRKPRKHLGSVLALFLTMGVGAPGCDTNFTLDTTLGEILDQVTVGDVVEAFQRFASNVGADSGFGPAALSAEQLSQLEDLQGRLNSGEITQEQFAVEIRGLIGDRAPNAAFGGFAFFGGPLGSRMRGPMAGPLDLSDEQLELAHAIFEQLHSDIRDLRSQSHDDIRAVLTDEQLAALDQLRADRAGRGLPRGLRHRPDRGSAGGRFFDRLAEELGLSEAQIAEITQLREDLRSAVETRHQQARDEFRNLLTDEQLEILDEIEARRAAHDESDAE